MFKILLVVLAVTIVGLFVMTKIDPNLASNSSTVEVSEDSEDNDDEVQVSIGGQILHAGSYTVDPDETLSYLIDLAGGVTENADPDAYTPGLVIGSRTSFYIPKLAEIPSTCTTEKISKVNVNTAEKEELISVKFSSSQAAALIDYRDTNGDFQAIEDIMKVSGIGEKTFAAVKDYITIS